MYVLINWRNARTIRFSVHTVEITDMTHSEYRIDFLWYSEHTVSVYLQALCSNLSITI